ncbi:MAG: 6-phosphogluconolactonase [Candidatus Tokpelaia sp. JSC188]|nr:MAG: 6-phosphogluconolactonase [Candidatus Tokpelaia sp. JSC188]
MNFDRYDFDTPNALASALAERVAIELSFAINERGQAVLVVSGGCTPKHFFKCLSQADIAWKQVIITLVDERFVPPDNSRSNEKLVRQHLMQNFATEARFVGLYTRAVTAELAAFSAANRVNKLAKPFDVVVLGMGLDGHTASFFPGGNRLRQALDRNSRALMVPMHARGLSEARLTITLPLLVSARFIALHIEGQEKLVTFEQVLQNGPEIDMPVRAVLRHAKSPIQVFWSPADKISEHEPSV